MAPITRSGAAKQAEEKTKSSHSSTTDKKILETPKRITGPVTRSVAAKLTQQKEDNQPTRCQITTDKEVAPQKEDNKSTRRRSTTDKEKALKFPTVKNTYHRNGSRSRVVKTVAHNTITKTKKKKKQFRCIFCNKKALFPTEPYPSCAVGHLDCMSCGAAFSFRVTANLASAKDVQAALSAGGDIEWLSAFQGILAG